MSAHNALEELNKEAEIEFNGKILDYGATVPSDGAAGFAPACIFIHADTGGGATDCVFVNQGTAASCDFDALTVS